MSCSRSAVPPRSRGSWEAARSCATSSGDRNMNVMPSSDCTGWWFSGLRIAAHLLAMATCFSASSRPAARSAARRTSSSPIAARAARRSWSPSSAACTVISAATPLELQCRGVPGRAGQRGLGLGCAGYLGPSPKERSASSRHSSGRASHRSSWLPAPRGCRTSRPTARPGMARLRQSRSISSTTAETGPERRR